MAVAYGDIATSEQWGLHFITKKDVQINVYGDGIFKKDNGG
jgi:hypothetical protein